MPPSSFPQPARDGSVTWRSPPGVESRGIPGRSRLGGLRPPLPLVTLRYPSTRPERAAEAQVLEVRREVSLERGLPTAGPKSCRAVWPHTTGVPFGSIHVERGRMRSQTWKSCLGVLCLMAAGTANAAKISFSEKGFIDVGGLVQAQYRIEQ